MSWKIIPGPKLLEISDDARGPDPKISRSRSGPRGGIWRVHESKIEVVSSRVAICQFGSILGTKYQLLYLRRFETDFDNFEICFRAIRFLSIPLLFIEISMDKSSLCAVILEHQSLSGDRELLSQDHSTKTRFVH